MALTSTLRGNTTCEGRGGDGRTTWFTACEGWGRLGEVASTVHAFPLVSSSFRFFLMHLIKKPETEFTGQVYERFW